MYATTSQTYLYYPLWESAVCPMQTKPRTDVTNLAGTCVAKLVYFIEQFTVGYFDYFDAVHVSLSGNDPR